MKNKLKILSALLLVFAAAACGIRTAGGALDAAEELMTERPDSALAVLEHVDTSTLRSAAAEARYSLLLSMALDKNIIDTADISIILPAVRYYSGRGDVHRKAQAYYYYGRVLQNGGDEASALEAISKAELYADQTDDQYLQGLIYDCKGRLYESKDELLEAIKLYSKAADIFKILNLRMNEMYLLEKLSGVYLQLDDSETAVRYALKAQDIALESEEISEIISTGLDVAYAYYIGGDPVKALDRLTAVSKSYLHGEIPSLYYMILSQIYLSLGDISNARYYAKLELDSAGDSAFPGVYALLQVIEYAAGNYKMSCDYYDLCFEALGRQHQLEYEESAYEADMRYKNKELVEIIDAQERHMQDVTIIWSLVIALIAASGLSVIEIRHRQLQKKDAEINEYRNKISTMQEYSVFLEKIKDSIPEKNELITRQVELLSKLMDILVHAQSKMRPPEYREFMELVRKGDMEGKEILNILRSAFESQYPGVLTLLEREHGELSEKDIDIYMLTNLGCSASVSAYIIGTSEGYVYNRRSGIRKKLGFSDDKISFSEHLQSVLQAMAPKYSQYLPQ